MLKKTAQMIKLYQAAPVPPQGAPMPMDPAAGGMPPQGAPMPPQGAPAPMDPAMAGGMPPQGGQAPQLDPLLDQLLQVFGQMPPGAFSELVAMPTDQLVEMAKQGQIPPMAVQLILYLRMSGPESGMGEPPTEETVKESAIRAIRGMLK